MSPFQGQQLRGSWSSLNRPLEAVLYSHTKKQVEILPVSQFQMRCRICGSTNVEMCLDLGIQPHCNRLIPGDKLGEREPHFPLRMGFCHDCTLVQIDHTIPKEEMFSDYPYISGTTATLVEHFKNTAARLTQHYGLTQRDLVVDIGSNDGTWLTGYNPFSLRVLGVEAAQNIAEIARAKGIPTLNRFFDEETADYIVHTEGQAKLVTAAGVFFHLEELHSVVRGVTKLLSDDGVLCVQAIYLGGMVHNLAFDQIYHEHLCYYTLRSIEALFSRYGLAVFDVNLQPIHGGSIEVHVCKAGERPVEAAVEAFRREETKKRLGEFATYRAFAEKVQRLCRNLKAVLEDYLAQGKTVYAYGAPAKGTTLLNSCGIDSRLVPMAIEKNLMKVGYWIPGVRIPIVDERTASRPDAYLMLAWNFLDEIMIKETDFLRAGGSFIVPVPEVRDFTKADLP